MAMKLSHTQALGVMLLATLLWSMAGIVSRQMSHAQDFELTFWRSFFTLVSLSFLLPLLKGRQLLRQLPWRQKTFWLSGVCWSVMFTALLSRFVMKKQLAAHTWWAMLVAGLGMAFMFISQVQIEDGQHLKGMMVALCVPLAGAVQWNVVQHLQASEAPADFMPAVWVGALLSSLYTAPLALNEAATWRVSYE